MIRLKAHSFLERKIVWMMHERTKNNNNQREIDLCLIEKLLVVRDCIVRQLVFCRSTSFFFFFGLFNNFFETHFMFYVRQSSLCCLALLHADIWTIQRRGCVLWCCFITSTNRKIFIFFLPHIGFDQIKTHAHNSHTLCCIRSFLFFCIYTEQIHKWIRRHSHTREYASAFG